MMAIVDSRKCGSSKVYFGPRRSLRVTGASHRLSATTKKTIFQSHSIFMCYSSGDVNLTTPDDAGCNLACSGASCGVSRIGLSG